PEPCVGVRKDGDEASVGEGIGQPWSRESQSPGADAVSSAEGNTFRTHHRKVRTARRGRRTWHVQKLLEREPGDPTGWSAAVRLALPPSQRRTTPGGILRPQARCRTGCGWADMAGLRGRPRSQDREPARPGPSGSISGSAVSATLHTEG